MVAGDWCPIVPAATVGPPRLADGVVGRPALVSRLLAARGGDLVTITAPAGYGKTTVATLWAAADRRPFAWMKIDHLDADPAHLLLHIATAVDTVSGIDRTVLRYLRGPGRPALTHSLPTLVRALETCGPLVVLLDDLQELTASAAVDTLRAFVEAAPATLTIAALGRGAPPVDLARRRLQHTLLELDAEDLKFSRPEAVAALESVGAGVPAEVASSIVDRCEGWPAGVVLAAMALRDGADAETFTGCTDLIADYLVEEVLVRLDDETTTFLLESSVLDRFSAGQLNAVLRRDDSARMLDDLSKSGNMFLISLDAERVWYRYHRLFRDLLRDRLRSRQPARFRRIASRAAELLSANGDVDGALTQALAAGDRAMAAALVMRDAVQLGFDGRAGVLARRVGLLDERTVAEFPDAAIARAWLGVTTGDAELIQRSLLQAGRSDRGRPLSDGTPSVKVAAALVSSLVGVNGVQDVLRQAEVVRGAGDHLVNRWWGAATVMMGAAQAMIGNTAAARMSLESALPVIGDLPGFHAAALAHLALLDFGDGDDEGGLTRSAQARSVADSHDLCDVVPMVVVYAVSAVTAARTGDTDAARAAVADTERLLDRLGLLAARTALMGHGLLAWTAALLHDPELLIRHLEAADRAARREPGATALTRLLDRVRALAIGTSRRPLTSAELRLLPHLATHLSLQQISETLRVGRETAKSQTASIYRKLGVSSRAAAVAEARRIGLLPA
ncbi:MAG: LuxR C-terminal-related transcriptional regulator [Mycobacterium sp.]|nr:LuxR C-terminal-related transcriptional regulator [Mycobacterium sp.]